MITSTGRRIDPEDPVWMLNQYRAAEVHGAGAIMRMARLADTAKLRSDLSRHLRDEAVHAWLWTKAIEELGGEVVDVPQPYQARLSAHFGIPKTLTDMLALTLASEKRGLAEYELHVGQDDLPQAIRRPMKAIIRDEAWHVSYIEEALQERAREDKRIDEIIARAEQADVLAVAELEAEAATAGG
ncbi:tRNA isopentenyl-2-thiomethyl-A-37 hydroxylase MiaE (synthesis of 2-methylthio-cis-ribozeatin) [Micromonospora nigra]|uniref:tRNA isopentenyl-2-thiomethyl-A-37 hydroxylase MiaE (Synthesis of 2-methylthio-cis-ribozeatin) n=1 Tax=Micromonospora nigra TaxID=145857 RepID=A0A1C6RCC8_9ACTN|nr:ferritin-like domain-containing protein [Micromonospora nigra]SCL14733.1 tRNA isopentenyl-2-thiomethyl-A-37 hydroxylase MiaE (synthesis of 2-methylthio-cis-ribozeatin) [Micromonospora nigra]